MPATAVINLKVQFVLRLTLIDCLSFHSLSHYRLLAQQHFRLIAHGGTTLIDIAFITVWCCWKWNHCNEADADFLETSSNDGRLNFTFCRSNATSERRNGCRRQCCRRWWVFIASSCTIFSSRSLILALRGTLSYVNCVWLRCQNEKHLLMLLLSFFLFPPTEPNPIQNNGLGVLSNKLSRLTLATFDDEGRCIGQMGSLSISY